MRAASQTDLSAIAPMRDARSSTFADNMALPVHRWFRYSAGFSASWAADVLARERSEGRRTVLDPFAGCATTLLAAQEAGLRSVGLEPHPFVARVAAAKLRWDSPIESFLNHAGSIGNAARSRKRRAAPANIPPLLRKCFAEETLAALYSLLSAWNGERTSEARLLGWLAIVSIVRSCSPVGTAQWQYVLPNKTKARALEPLSAFEVKTNGMALDMAHRRRALGTAEDAEILECDARTCEAVADGWADLVLTSPPYANNYDYADATRLEMTVLGDVANWGDLQETVRARLLRSCTQHVSSVADAAEELLESPLLQSIRGELVDVWRKLAAVREHRGGRKPYHAMVVYYFYDLAQVWRALRAKTAAGAKVCFVVGDSAPYGIYVPVERWLGELAVAHGFRSYRFDKMRDRNTKWKNRKHRVPLQEGCLWVDG